MADRTGRICYAISGCHHPGNVYNKGLNLGSKYGATQIVSPMSCIWLDMANVELYILDKQGV